MVEKFSVLKDRFKTMYNKGITYGEMARKLQVNTLTLRAWREKLDLPLRRSLCQRSWMDVPDVTGVSPRETLQSIAKAFGFTQHDIEFILVRFDKFRSRGLVKGRRYDHAILAAAFLYLQWEGARKVPVSAAKFVGGCKDPELSRSRLLQLSSVFKEANLYPKMHLQSDNLLEKTWRKIQDKYDLPEAVKVRAIALMATPQLKERALTPYAVVAACMYIASKEQGYWISQWDLAEFFGVTEVTIRNAIKLLTDIEPDSARVQSLQDSIEMS